MDLDELKKVWDATGAQLALHEIDPGLSKESMHQSRRLVSSMLHNLRIELAVVIVSVAAIASYYFLAYDGKLQQVSWLYIALAALFGIYYYRKSRLLNAMSVSEGSVKSSLQRQLQSLEKLVQLYLIAGALAVPLVLLVFYLLLYEGSVIITGGFNIHSKGFGLVYLLFTAIFTVLLFICQNWLIQRFYGRHIQALKNLIAEMQEEPV